MKQWENVSGDSDKTEAINDKIIEFITPDD